MIKGKHKWRSDFECGLCVVGSISTFLGQWVTVPERPAHSAPRATSNYYSIFTHLHKKSCMQCISDAYQRAHVTLRHQRSGSTLTPD